VRSKSPKCEGEAREKQGAQDVSEPEMINTSGKSHGSVSASAFSVEMESDQYPGGVVRELGSAILLVEARAAPGV
jgi:hypothetical protein